jgi:hypothetical protein
MEDYGQNERWKWSHSEAISVRKVPPSCLAGGRSMFLTIIPCSVTQERAAAGGSPICEAVIEHWWGPCLRLKAHG